MRQIFLYTFALLSAGSLHALPEQVNPRMDSLTGTVSEIKALDDSRGFLLVRMKVDDKADIEKLKEIHTALRQRTYTFNNQAPPRRGEALLLFENGINGNPKLPKFEIGDTITIAGYGVTLVTGKGGHSDYKTITIDKKGEHGGAAKHGQRH